MRENKSTWTLTCKRIAAYLLVTSAALLAAGCGSLPRINPDMALKAPHHPIKLEGARGPLSYKQSRAILAKLKRGGEDSDIFDRHLALQESITGTRLTIGNKVHILIDGPATYAAMFKAIDAAKDNINLETFILESDEVGQKFAAALIAKQQAGVQVNLIYDSVGSLGTPKSFFDRMRQSGINVLEYNPVNPLTARAGWDVNERDHRKLLVVDGKIAFVGGINISSVYSSGSSAGLSQSSGSDDDDKQDADKEPHWRDTHLRIEGPVVADFQKLFMETWQKQKGKPLAEKNYFPKLEVKGKAVVQAIGSSPDDPFSLMYVTLLSAINSAESQVELTNAYFVPDKQLLAALENAAKRGVDVKLLLPSTTDSNLVFYASRSFYDELLQSGVKIYERQDALLHAKTALIDGVWSTIGSTNLDWRSFLYNQEINAVILGQEFGDKMQAMFDDDLQASKRITLEQWEDRSLLMRIKEWGASLWARLL
ncbi:MAG TPA: cardiolipin synthase [Methylophilaceae bacterium]|nr:cardiolipin synthase [Methylophilaceae bacterium]